MSTLPEIALSSGMANSPAALDATTAFDPVGRSREEWQFARAGVTCPRWRSEGHSIRARLSLRERWRMWVLPGGVNAVDTAILERARDCQAPPPARHRRRNRRCLVCQDILLEGGGVARARANTSASHCGGNGGLGSRNLWGSWSEAIIVYYCNLLAASRLCCRRQT